MKNKLAAGAGVAAIAAAGGGYGVKNYFDIPDMPTYKTVAEIGNSLSTSYSSDKVGNVYSKYLVNPNEESNKEWWEWSFKYILFWGSKNGLSSEFSKVKEAYKKESGGSETHLNKVCEAAFKKQTDSSFKNTKYESDMWHYCSVFVIKPLTIKDLNEQEAYPADSVIKTHTDLASTKDARNGYFWKIKEEEFFASADGKTESNTFFKTFYDKNKDKSKEERESLKDKCEEAYNMNSTSDPTPASVKSNCSFHLLSSN
ncbi:hypothetical protein MHSWG343_10180 [Candidatus Mycoplasma haematohominis]|uniref:Uncharacterized protein n=1 Tax=Candidatus Mycoplasma haematohominis TaxID=1494318 RepID=A0A478FVG1_9MOLU|nr:hypothetical protein MHSWG343_10180 [Candidatus Mycoplasma haemohominis]